MKEKLKITENVGGGGGIMSLPCGMMILSQPAKALADGLHATCKK